MSATVTINLEDMETYLEDNADKVIHAHCRYRGRTTLPRKTRSLAPLVKFVWKPQHRDHIDSYVLEIGDKKSERVPLLGTLVFAPGDTVILEVEVKGVGE